MAPQSEPGSSLRDQIVLVTGAAGFVGAHIAAAALRAGAKEVRALDVRPPDVDAIARRAGDAGARARVVALAGVDVRDRARVRAAAAGARAVVAVAGYGMSGGAMLDARACDAVNVDGTRNLLQACEDGARVVYVSSPNVVFGGAPIAGGDERLGYFETERHTDAYSPSKARAERLVLATGARSRALAACALRPGAIHGAGEERHLPRVAGLARWGLWRVAIGAPAVLSDWCHVSNLADAALRALDALDAPDSPAAGEAFFVSDGEPVNTFELLEPPLSSLLPELSVLDALLSLRHRPIIPPYHHLICVHKLQWRHVPHIVCCCSLFRRPRRLLLQLGIIVARDRASCFCFGRCFS